MEGEAEGVFTSFRMKLWKCSGGNVACLSFFFLVGFSVRSWLLVKMLAVYLGTCLNCCQVLQGMHKY